MEQPILLFILIVVLLWLMLLSLGQMLLGPFYLLMSLGQNKIFHKIFHNFNMLVGKTISFIPDEANVDDMAKACEWQQIYSV